MLVLPGSRGHIVQNEIQNEGAAHKDKNWIEHDVSPCPWESLPRQPDGLSLARYEQCDPGDLRRSMVPSANLVPKAENHVSVLNLTFFAKCHGRASFGESAKKCVTELKPVEHALSEKKSTLQSVG
jgi:hypothetical protein